MTKNPVCLVIGAGDGTGSAIGQRFAREGYSVCLARRQQQSLTPHVEAIKKAGGQAHGYELDAAHEHQMVDLIKTIEADVGPIEVAVYNVGGFVKGSIGDLTSEDFRNAWNATCFGAFVLCRQLAPLMTQRGKGTLLFTGATASLRGGAQFAALAVAKHGLRALVQSVARELAPKGIHAAHIIIDGGIDTPATRARYADLIADLPADGMLKPDDIAEAYWQLHRQPKSAWSQELDLRPWCEKW